MNIRKTLVHQETIYAEGAYIAATPITRVAAMAIVSNPMVGRESTDLSELFAIGADVGERLSAAAVALLPNPPVSYGKAAIVGADGEFEHGGACIHPKLGKPMRAATGGGEAVIPSNVKVGSLGCSIDVPLGHKDNVWSFDHFDTMTVSIADSPRAHEIVIVMAFADGGRVNPRCGTGPV